MPYEIIWENRGVYRRYYGHTTDLEVSQSVGITQASPQFDELRFAILDFRDVTGYEVANPTFIQETSAIDSAAANSNPNINIAIIATTPGIMKLAEEYATHQLTPYPTKIFSNMDDARHWATTSPPRNNRFHKRSA